MDELIPFHEIDIYANDKDWDDDHNYIGPYSESQIEAADFLLKMDWEGGLDELIGYGGWTYFPLELQSQAKKYQTVKEELNKAVIDWAAERGVSY